ncbi:Pvc16 family protein [Actinokineospora bangkokensis]|uniref:Pvc16 N-terminal domain-containing protein n=1 Tax=Actinokineospora bangkokensis TaxID=1193682 RepID=A0A1Q9LK77_9PSEU|nr:Pvc16 family protein [Actinokineospora bangkokensis]OLR92403.1 hypothetical protein BJP25_20160 [Actinokineospora bangkokensis]
MLADVDSSLRAWLTDELAPGTEIGFDPPGLLTGIPRRPRRAGIVNLFLHAVTENLDGLPAGRVRVRDTEGRVTGSHVAHRSYHLSYLVTAWAADTTEEHELLGALIGAHTERDALHPDHLRGCLSVLDTALPVRLGWTPAARTAELWSAVGVPMRTALDLTITAPALPARFEPPAPPVEAVHLEVHGAVAPPPEVPRRRWERTAINES